MKKLWELFSTFFRIGLFTFGGGLSMLPLVHREAVERKKWITEDKMIDIIAIAQSTPGVIAVNTATFVGYKVSKFWGSFFAALGVITPSLIIIMIIATFFNDIIEYPIVEAVFKGISAGVVVLIFNAGIKIFRKCPKTFITYIIIAIAIILSLLRIVNVFLIILIGGVIGLITQTLKNKRGDINAD